ncbi:MAG: DNA polymerase III subunit gamma/tau [Aromatoleum sp.]|jgi:DNA polymerase-3 subunit gamma/tau|uniref:DNA polymerase III subunit gamma/tau n=1 Tax=Aromatoleum sp. TaxID=2307007 RepID=UPI00289449D0|nr:DNA polymerase III subunit gamma/tau [Aromatoleum sp.]MDT3668858.1 DNA polymerase III subunit gamma/tau [Aromatoleum sp.]
MSYQVLARKWRPKSFATLIGQEHVVRALSHALATGRLHHAWLFTGTRGVGKTTISRILAKALNCETGVTAEPCGKCAACQAIDADRFPDYVEMDAASNRGVEDMAALLDKAVYAPVQGRYKVYMIDEVHMLTGHAFNAMLKTLEEPPEHVKFILATTDPQKIPVTVLSRCLQFNLKQMPPGHIVDHLAGILAAEDVPFEAPALRHLAKAAGGSMRDALSLLDQAIAHGSGKVEEEQVTHMLGTVGDDHLYAVLDALAAGDVSAMLAVADRMEARSLSFDAALQALASLLHRIALAQFAQAAIADESERQRLLPYTQAFDAEFLQLAYQIAIHGRDELSLAPDDYAGFTMSLLRLHAFRPESPAPLGSPGAAEGGGGAGGARSGPSARSPRTVPQDAGTSERERNTPAGSVDGVKPIAERARPAVPSVSDDGPRAANTASPTHRPETLHGRDEGTASPRNTGRSAGAASALDDTSGPSNSVPPWEDLPPEGLLGESRAGGREATTAARTDSATPVAAATAAGQSELRHETVATAHAIDAGATESANSLRAVAETSPESSDLLPEPSAASGAADWHATVRSLGLGGMVRELAQHCEWIGLADDVVGLRLSETHRHLLGMNPTLADRLQDALSAFYERPLRLRIETGAIAGETPAQRDQMEKRARHVEAVAALERDPFVRELIERFDASLVEASVKPL